MRLLYIFDLDGTLADIEHRRHLIEGSKKNWDAFYAACVDDEPVKAVVRICNGLISNGADVWIWSGRSDAVREETEEWLRTWVPTFKPSNLMMRPADDRRSDVELKKKWWRNLSDVDQTRLSAIFEDRTSVVNMWRDLGLTCFQVAPGDF